MKILHNNFPQNRHCQNFLNSHGIRHHDPYLLEQFLLIPGQFVEKAYSFSWDDLFLLPLRVHGEEALRGYLFIIFLSLMVYMEVQKEIGSVEMAFDTLRNLKCKVFDKEIVIQELTRDQKKLFEKIGVMVSNTMGI